MHEGNAQELGNHMPADIRHYLERGDKSSERMPELLSILIGQARSAEPITYGDVADELGVHHRAVHHIAGYIGFTLAEIAKLRDWRHRPPPPIHALIVNAQTGLPGSGIDGFMAKAYRDAPSADAKRAVMKAVYAEAQAYPCWRELCDLLAVPLDERDLAGAVEMARRAGIGGGESADHLALKEYVRGNPHIVGLAPDSEIGETEYLTAAGDRIDVLFRRPGLQFAVEVKPHHASEGDVLRGVFQCLKYRAVLKAEAALAGRNVRTKALLLLGGSPTAKVIRTANRLGIDILREIEIPGARIDHA